MSRSMQESNFYPLIPPSLPFPSRGEGTEDAALGRTVLGEETDNPSNGKAPRACLQSAQTGQGGLVTIAVMVLLALSLGAMTLSGMSFLGGKRAVVTKQTLQTYYTAQAGIQEAVASRMFPRSNYAAFVQNPNFPAPPSNPVNPQIYYSNTGAVYEDPANRTNLLGMYRYIVLGGDSARKEDGSFYPNSSGQSDYWDLSGTVPRLVAPNTIPPSSPFIVISHGVSCKSRQGSSLVGVNQLRFSSGLGSKPYCQDGSQYFVDEVTLVATVRLSQESGDKDRIERTRYYKDGTRIRLPYSAFAPGYGWASTGTDLNFETLWAYSPQRQPGTENNPLTLKHVAFYNFATNQIYVSQNVTGPITVIGTTIPGNAAIRLYFNGPVDYRSISPTMNRSLSDCIPQLPAKPYQQDNCNIRVVPNPPISLKNHAYAGNTTVPMLPGGTQILLLPPFNKSLSGVTPHEIQVDATRLRGYSNSAGPQNYVIRFNAQ